MRSKQVDGNFDIYASYRHESRWSDELRVTSHRGPDISPAAATDADGTVWITWQGYLDSLDMLVARQDGEGVSAEQAVSISAESDWAPQIAATRSTGVAISWYTYNSGNYDVYARRLSYGQAIEMEAPVAVAASLRFEARSSVAFDSQDRFWVAPTKTGFRPGARTLERTRPPARDSTMTRRCR